MWDLSSQPGIEPVPPALEGEVLTTGPPGKSLEHVVLLMVAGVAEKKPRVWAVGGSFYYKL